MPLLKFFTDTLRLKLISPKFSNQKKNHVFISSVGYYEFYNNKKLRIGAAGPETIWQKQ